MRMLALALVPPMVAGYLLAGRLRVGPDSERPSALLRLCLALGWGLGTSSCVFFAWLVVAGAPGRAFLGADLAVFAGLAAVGVVARARGGAGESRERARRLPRFIEAGLGVALAASLGIAVVLFVLLSINFPHGGWDALSIWNLRARFLYLGGDSWAEAFHPALIASHLDYPLLVPATIARCWAYLGRDSTAVPAMVALAFALAIVGLLGSALAALRSRSQGVMGGLVLLASPDLFELGSKQFADIPLAYFVLATAVALALSDRGPSAREASRWMVLAGLMAGFAAWTKNEGLLFLGAVLVARLLVVVPTRGWRAYCREAAGFALGLAPALAVVVYFKVRFTPPNDFLAAQGPAAIAAKLADPSRYALVGRALGEQVSGLGTGAVSWLIAYRLLLGGAPRRAGGSGGATAWLVLVLVLAAYVLVYVATPLYLPWHLQWSLIRLIIHLWPLAVFAFFLTVATPEEALAGTPEDASVKPRAG